MPRLWLIPIIILFLGATLYQLTLPGLHYDEAVEAVPAMQLLKNQPVTPFRNSALIIFGKKFPLVTQDYIGALNTYGTLPFLALGGINATSLRSYAVLIGLITLLLSYGFTSALTRNKTAGLVAASLLVVNPTFLFWSRQGIFVTAISAAIGVGAAWSWLNWWRSKDHKFAILGAFLFGLGLYAKLLFLWLIAALFGIYILARITTIFWPKYCQTTIKLSPGQIFDLLVASIAGCWFLIVYNLQTGGTFKHIRDNAVASYYGVDNTNVLPNLWTRINQLVILLNSGHFQYLGGVYSNNLVPIIFAIALILSLWLTYKYKTITSLIPFLVIGLVVVESIVTVSALSITHYALIMVWPAIALATTGAQLAYRFSKSTSAKFVLRLAFALLVATETKTTLSYHQILTTSGGLNYHSNAIYDMAAWLDSNTTGPVVAMDWGIAAPITFLTAGQVTPIEVFGYDWTDTNRFAYMVTPYLNNRNAIFLWHVPDKTLFNRRSAFETLYHSLKLQETTTTVFYERDDQPILYATQLVPPDTRVNPDPQPYSSP